MSDLSRQPGCPKIFPSNVSMFSSVTDLLEQEKMKSQTQNCYSQMCTNCNYVKKIKWSHLIKSWLNMRVPLLKKK